MKLFYSASGEGDSAASSAGRELPALAFSLSARAEDLFEQTGHLLIGCHGHKLSQIY